MAIKTSHTAPLRDSAALVTVRRLVADWRIRRRERRDERRVEEMLASIDEATLRDIGLENLAGPRP